MKTIFTMCLLFLFCTGDIGAGNLLASKKHPVLQTGINKRIIVPPPRIYETIESEKVTSHEMRIFADGVIIRVPEDQSSIQAGIDAAVSGDTVLVADSTYYENINFKGKAITVASYYLMDSDTNHINNTIINGSQAMDPNKGSVVSFVSGEDTNSVICGFTITGGTGTLYAATFRVGGGIFCVNSGARIAHNKVIFNTINHTDECEGGGIGCWPLSNAAARYVIIENNVIESNTISSSNTESFISGGGVFIVKGRITGNIIRFNTVTGQPIFAGGGGIEANCEDTASRTLVIISENTITNNQAETPVNYGGWGGGIDVVFCNVQILDNKITNNQVGGSQGLGAGVRLWRSKNISILKDNIISFNKASGSTYEGLGGGLMYHETSGISVRNNSFESNTSEYGGAIFEESSVGGIIADNEFVNNTADSSAGAFYFQQSSLSIKNNLFSQNRAKYGGAIFNYSGTYQITNNTFVENQASGWGGAILSLYNSTSNITGNEFFNNLADSSGGACDVEHSNLSFSKNLFIENSAKYGGAILCYSGNYPITNNIIADNTAQSGGGILSVDKLEDSHLVQIINNTLTGNTADTAGAVICHKANVIVMNTICWKNFARHGSSIEIWGGTVNVAYSDVAWASAGFEGVVVDSAATFNWLDGNIDTDPLFVPGDSLYHLICTSDTSVCLNTGIDALQIDGVWYYAPLEDYGGNPRPHPNGTMPDMGAWESDIVNTLEEFSGKLLPLTFELKQNYPNPFNPNTTIEFFLPKSVFVTLKIYNTLGQEVTTLVAKKLPPGQHQCVWNAEEAASGVYLYRLQAGGFSEIRKCLLLK